MFFWPQTIENRAALRTAIAALASVLISFKFHLETPFWSGMTVVLITNLYTGNVIDKAMLRIIGTIAGAFLGFYVSGLVANSFVLYLLVCFLILSLGSYYFSFSKNGYAYLLGALSAFIIISQIAFTPQNAFWVAIWRPVEIGIGVLVSAISAYFIFPNNLNDTVSLKIQEIYIDFSAEFNQLANILYQEKPDFAALAQNHFKLKRKIHKANELIGAMHRELGVSKERVDEVRALLGVFLSLARQLAYLIHISPQYPNVTSIHSLPIESVLHVIQEDFIQLQKSFSNQLETPLILKTGTVIEALEKQVYISKSLDVARDDLAVTPTAMRSEFIHVFIHFLHQVNRSFNLMYSLLMRIPMEMESTFQILNTQERLRTDANLIKRSIKTGIAAILALSFWMLTSWPGGLNGIVSSLVISLRRNLFEMKNVSIHRLIGCMIGGGIAIFSLFLLEVTLYDFILIFFFSVWGFTYFMFKSPKYSYIGLQANIALIIAFAQEGGPPVYLAPVLQRVGGIIIGIAASFIVANLLWRADIWTMLNRYLNKIYLLMTHNLKQVLLLSGKQKKIHDMTNLFWYCRELLESLADEPLNEKKQSILSKLTERFESLVVIQATISHILLAINKEKIEKMTQILGIDLAYYEMEAWVSFEQHDAARGLYLSHQLQECLSKMVLTQIEDEDLRGILAYLNALNQLVLRIH